MLIILQKIIFMNERYFPKQTIIQIESWMAKEFIYYFKNIFYI